MDYGEFSKDRPTYHKLSDGYALKSASERDFGVNYAIYRNANPDFDEFLDYGSDLEGLNYCFWVLKHDVKVGGIIIRPNHIEGLFLRPPFIQSYEVLRAVLPVLFSWSDTAKEIEAVDVMPCELELYQRLGFRTHSARRVYIKPTEPFGINWANEYDVLTPTSAHVSEVAALFHIGYRDYPGEWLLGPYSLQDWTHRTEGRLAGKDVPEICHRASTLVYDRSRKLPVGACIVRLSRSIIRPDVGYPKVLDISVHPEYRRQGIGTKMLKKALSALYGEYPVLKFGVAVGNPAEAFYYDLGFLPGITQYRLVKPPLSGSDKETWR